MALEIGGGITIGRGIGVSMTPTITVATQPSTVTSYQGQTATFSISASVDLGAVLTYQWAKLEAQGGTWANITNATSSSYTTDGLNVATDNGDRYRCILSATRGTPQVTSSSAILYVEQAVITITSQPQNATVVAGDTVSFSVTAEATLSATLSYQWYVYYSWGWSTITGATSSSYTYGPVSEGDASQAFRVIVSATKGATSVTSNTANLTIVVNNTMTVASSFNGFGTTTGASKGNRISALGTLTSDYFEAVYTYNDGTFVNTWVTLTPGTYSGFVVQSNSAIDSDTASYPRIFTINSTDYRMVFNQYEQAYTVNGSIGLTSGTTIPVVFNGGTPVLTPNTIILGTYEASGQLRYGANTGIDSDGGYAGPTFGTVVTSYFLEVSNTYDGSSWTGVIRMKNGSYSGFSVSSGLITGDSSGSTRIFTIGGTNYTFSALDNAPFDSFYAYSGQITEITAGTIGGDIPCIYDPNQQGGGGDNTAVGTMTIGYMAGRYGWQSGAGYGSASISPSMIAWIYYDQVDSQTRVQFINGTYGSVVVDSSSVDGETSVTVTVGSVTETATLTVGSGFGPTAMFSGDVFNLVNQNYQTVPVEILAGTGGGSGTTYIGGMDYASDPYSPTQPGIIFSNPPPGPYVFVTPSSWTTPAGAAALLALSSGSTFTVSAFPAGGGAPVTSTITLTGNWNTDWGPGGSQGAPFTSSPTVSTSNPDNIPLSVTLTGGGGGTEVILTIGFWGLFGGMFPNPSRLILLVSETNTAGITAMDSLASGATITLNDPSTTPPTVEVTLSGSLTKTGPYGSPPNYQYDGSTTAENTDPTKYQNLTSVTLPGGGGGTTTTVASGDITVGTDGWYCGYDPGFPLGSSTISPPMVARILYIPGGQNSTLFSFLPGSYGSVTVTSSAINGESSVTVSVGGLSQTGTLVSGGPYATMSFSGDVFNLQGRVGQSLSVSASITSSGGGGSSQTFTQAGNWVGATWMYNGMGTGRLSLDLDSNPNSSFLSAINAISGTSGTTVTMTDSTHGTSSAIAITGVSGQPFGPYSSGYFYLASHTGQDWYSINTLVFTTAGGGGATVSVTNALNITWEGMDQYQNGTLMFYFDSPTNQTAAYNKLNLPGTWNIQGWVYYMGQGFNSHASYSVQISGPSSTDQNGPPWMQYRVLTPCYISGSPSYDSGSNNTATKQ